MSGDSGLGDIQIRRQLGDILPLLGERIEDQNANWVGQAVTDVGMKSDDFIPKCVTHDFTFPKKIVSISGYKSIRIYEYI